MGSGFHELFQKSEGRTVTLHDALFSNLSVFMLYCSEDFCAIPAEVLVPTMHFST